jgi:tetratricopeptide (TPR) repeat protein/3D (Asp-Asp-Asp) domain-containing protein
MKSRNLSGVVCLLLIFISVSANVSKEDAKSFIFDLVGSDVDDVNIYVVPEILSGFTYEVNPYKTINTTFSNWWLFFIDDNPQYNWGHNCRYVFIDSITGNYEIIEEILPPMNYNDILEVVLISIPIDNFDYNINNDLEDTNILSSREPDPHKYAILLSGETEIRNWNNMSALYSTLKNVYGFIDENIIVLSHNGQQNSNHNISLDLDRDGQDDIMGACTYENVQNAFLQMTQLLVPDDILFVYGSNHGGNDDIEMESCMFLYEGEPLWDYDFATFIEPINCSQIIFLLDFCYAGGFRDDLQGEHRTVHTAIEWNLPTVVPTLFGFDFFSYFWITATRRIHPLSKFYPWLNSEYSIGMHPDTQFIISDFDPDLEEFGGNGDGFTQMGEAFFYADEMMNRAIIQIPYQSTNIGFEEDLLSISGMTGVVENSQTVAGNFILSENGLTIQNGVTLTITESSNFYLSNQSRIISYDSSIIEIGDNVLFRGESYTIPGDETNPEIPGNRIEIYGDITIGDNVQFIANESNYWDGLYLYEGSAVTFNNPTFTNCNLISEETPLVINGGVFTNSWLEQSGHDIEIDGTDFVDSFIRAKDYTFRQCNFKLENSTITNTATGTAVTVTSYWNYLIRDNSINSNGIALDISKSGYGYNREIADNVIAGNSNGYGIFLFNTYADIIGSNRITNKNVGIVGINKSQINIVGNREIPFQQIHHNNFDELIFTHDSFPYRFRYNQIYDNNHDNYLLKCADHGYGREHNVANNYWSSAFDPRLDFYPDYAFIWEPVWDPIEANLRESELLFIQAKEYEDVENYALAEQSYKSVIETYPEDDFAVAAAKELLALTSKSSQNYMDLKTYYNTDPNILNDEELNPLAGALSNYCDVGLQQYESAIDYFEALIASAATLQDSIAAVLELGFTYLLMENTGRSNYVGKFAELKPKSVQAFEKNRSELLTMLWGNAEEINLNSEIPKAVTLFNNYPNPFNPETKISFSIPNEAKVNLAIYNIKGQKVMTVASGEYERGMHQVVWNGKDQNSRTVASGVYFYKLDVNGKTEAVKKMMLLK